MRMLACIVFVTMDLAVVLVMIVIVIVIAMSVLVRVLDAIEMFVNVQVSLVSIASLL